MYYLDTAGVGDTRLRNALIVALIVHAALALGVSFSNTDSRQYARQIEVTLATRPTDRLPEEALHIAQANQEGSGDEAPVDEVTSANNLPAVAPTGQAAMRSADEQSEIKRDVVSTTTVSLPVTTTDTLEQEQRRDSGEAVRPELERLSEEIETLEAALDRDTRTYSNQSRVRRLTASSARQSADAAYLLDWRQRLEAVGNKYYPQASVRYGLYGDLRMLVVIRQDGSLEDIQVLSSSGYAVLDEAAIKIVRMAAPYSPFPPELKATTDKLEIVRTWHFQENPLSSQ